MCFRVSLSAENVLIIREELSLDVIVIARKKVKHTVNTTARFSAANVLDNTGADYSQYVKGN